jgi:hypothetical protein
MSWNTRSHGDCLYIRRPDFDSQFFQYDVLQPTPTS